jgi:hypothetical protein
MNGYLKIVNPDGYQEILNEGYDNTNNEIVFAVTGFGDFLVWTGDAVRIILFRFGQEKIINSNNIVRFFDRRLCDETFLQIELFNNNFVSAKNKYGDLAFDECFGYVPLLGMGGKEKIENIQKVKIIEHICIIAEMMGKIE